MRATLVLAGILLFVATALGCAGESRPAAAPSERPSPERPLAPRPLEDAWYQDSDRNTIPDFIEARDGYDPRADDCLPDRCKAPPGVSSAELTEGKSTLLALDSSGSMAGSAGGGQTKLEAAKEAIAGYVESTPRSVDRLGLEVYGHKGSSSAAGKAESCRGVEIFSPIGELDSGNVDRILARFQPVGWTPVAGALRGAERAFAGREGERNQVILVSDGVETCDGDPVRAARALNEAGVNVTVDVVGFDIRSQVDAQRLRRVAEAGGGEYVDAKTSGELNDYFDRLAERRAELQDSLSCISGTQIGAIQCQSRLYTDATFALVAERTDANFAAGTGPPEDRDRNRARGMAIDAIVRKVVSERDRVLKATLADRQQRLDEVSKEIEEINERLRRR